MNVCFGRRSVTGGPDGVTEMTAEQMLPVEKWGTLHGIAPIYVGGPDIFVSVGIIAQQDGTEVSVGTRMFNLNRGERQMLEIFARSDFVTVESNHPVQVSQTGVSGGQNYALPYGLLVPPMKLYSTFYAVVVPQLNTELKQKTRIAIVAHDDDKNYLTLNRDGQGHRLELDWTPLVSNSGLRYVGATHIVDTESHFVVRSTNGGKFGVSLLASSDSECTVAHALFSSEYMYE